MIALALINSMYIIKPVLKGSNNSSHEVTVVPRAYAYLDDVLHTVFLYVFT